MAEWILPGPARDIPSNELNVLSSKCIPGKCFATEGQGSSKDSISPHAAMHCGTRFGFARKTCFLLACLEASPRSQSASGFRTVLRDGLSWSDAFVRNCSLCEIKDHMMERVQSLESLCLCLFR
jgi:hypothetical protein